MKKDGKKVKSLFTVRAETKTPVSAISILRIPRVPADMPLYDILDEFQKGSSHMASVVEANADMGKSLILRRHPRHATNMQPNSDAVKSRLPPSDDIEGGEVIGIITLEDVFEELLQVGQIKQVPTPRKSGDANSTSTKNKESLGEPLLGNNS
ncbi:ion channel [Lithospermum erythrorhizon]|uniref:Ion channel n=1 Tax=Lithospermum erythrorhizon TaxID=34254 RepID=A0AAV3RRW4_LITER